MGHQVLSQATSGQRVANEKRQLNIADPDESQFERKSSSAKVYPQTAPPSAPIQYFSSRDLSGAWQLEAGDRAPWKQAAERLIDASSIQFALGICVVLSLCIGELWIIANVPVRYDIIINSCLIILLVFFLAEWVLMSILKKGYRFSLFFWTDLVGSLSLILELTHVQAVLSNYEGGATLFRATRAVKVLTRTGRLAKLARLFRLFAQLHRRRWLPRLSAAAAAAAGGSGGGSPAAPLLKERSSLAAVSWETSSVRTAESERRSSAGSVASAASAGAGGGLPGAAAGGASEGRATRLSAALSLTVTIRAVALVMALVLCVPVATHVPEDLGARAGLETLAAVAAAAGPAACDAACAGAALAPLRAAYAEGGDAQLVEVALAGLGATWDWRAELYGAAGGPARPAWLSTVAVAAPGGGGGSYLVLDRTGYQRRAAAGHLLVLAVACSCLVVFVAGLTRTLDLLVIRPLDRMMVAIKNSTASIMGSLMAMEDMVQKGEFQALEGRLETDMLEDLLKRMAELLQKSQPHADNRRLQQLLDESLTPMHQTDGSGGGGGGGGGFSRRRFLSRSEAGKGARGGGGGGGGGRTPGHAARRAAVMPYGQDTRAWLVRNFVQQDDISRAKKRRSVNLRKLPTLRGAMGGGGGGGGKEAGAAGAGGRRLSRLDVAVRKASSQLLRDQAALGSPEGLDFAQLVDSWDFNALAVGAETLHDFTAFLFELCGASEHLRCPAPRLRAFFRVLESNYRAANPYHTFRHGVDVAYTTLRLLNLSLAAEFLEDREVVALMVAALAHDVGHLGVNNAYLVQSRHKVALRYNDRSPLENMHVAILYTILHQEECNIFQGLSKQEWKDCRAVIIKAVLGTDMQHHFQSVNQVELFARTWAPAFRRFHADPSHAQVPEPMREREDRLMMMDLLLHAADISSPTKPPAVFKLWAERVLEEFFLQGDQEKANDMEVSPMMDRDKADLPNLQMGFIEFVVSPLYFALCDLYPGLEPVKENLFQNYQYYADIKQKELADRQLAAAGGAPGTAAAADSARQEAGQLKAKVADFEAKCRPRPARPRRRHPGRPLVLDSLNAGTDDDDDMVLQDCNTPLFSTGSKNRQISGGVLSPQNLAQLSPSNLGARLFGKARRRASQGRTRSRSGSRSFVGPLSGEQKGGLVKHLSTKFTLLRKMSSRGTVGSVKSQENIEIGPIRKASNRSSSSESRYQPDNIASRKSSQNASTDLAVDEHNNDRENSGISDIEMGKEEEKVPTPSQPRWKKEARKRSAGAGGEGTTTARRLSAKILERRRVSLSDTHISARDKKEWAVCSSAS